VETSSERQQPKKRRKGEKGEGRGQFTNGGAETEVPEQQSDHIRAILVGRRSMRKKGTILNIERSEGHKGKKKQEGKSNRTMCDREGKGWMGAWFS